MCVCEGVEIVAALGWCQQDCVRVFVCVRATCLCCCCRVRRLGAAEPPPVNRANPLHLPRPPPRNAGGMLSQARHTALFALVPRARRFFPAAAAAEVWAAARPALASGDPASNAALMSLGWLVLFFPTKRVPECDPSEVRRGASDGSVCSAAGGGAPRGPNLQLSCWKLLVLKLL